MSSGPCGKSPNPSGGRGRASRSGRGASPSCRGASLSGRSPSPSGRGFDNSMEGKNKGQLNTYHPCGNNRRSYDGRGGGRGGTGTGMSNTGRAYSGPGLDFSGSGEGKVNQNSQQFAGPGQESGGVPSQGYSTHTEVYVSSSQGRSSPRQMFIDSPNMNSSRGSKMVGGPGNISCTGSFRGPCHKSSGLRCNQESADGRSYMPRDQNSYGPSVRTYRSGDPQSDGIGDGSNLNEQNTCNPKFEMNEASWGLCKAAAIFLTGVYLTTRMHNVANLIG